MWNCSSFDIGFAQYFYLLVPDASESDRDTDDHEWMPNDICMSDWKLDCINLTLRDIALQGKFVLTVYC